MLDINTPEETVRTFCENVGVSGLEVTHFRSLEQEFLEPNVEELSGEFFDEESLIGLFIAIRAYEQYHTENLNYPTTLEQIKPIAEIISTSLGGENVNEKYLEEM